VARAGQLGGATVLAGLLLYALLGRQGYVWIALALVLTSAGMRVVLVIASVTVVRGLPKERTSTGAALSDTSQEVASSVGLAVTGTVIAAALTGPLVVVGRSAAATRAFEDAVTAATLALTAVCTLLVVWASRRYASVDRQAAPGPTA